MRIILGSGSPRRKDLMKMIGKDFEVIVSRADETFEPGISIEDQSIRLARLKAKAVFDITEGDRIVIGSDTMVIKGDKILEKPKDKEDAKRMINDLKNTSHEVITSLCCIIEKEGRVIEKSEYDKTKVYFTDITDAEIDKWVQTGKCMDKAGAYAMQDEGFGVFVDKIEGNYTTVVGMPMHKLYKMIKEYLY